MTMNDFAKGPSSSNSALFDSIPVQSPLASLGEADMIDHGSNPSTLTKPERIKQIWAIGGGKGGVGKSLIASSISIALARMGYRVIAIDLDLGGANLHTSLGV